VATIDQLAANSEEAMVRAVKSQHDFILAASQAEWEDAECCRAASVSYFEASLDLMFQAHRIQAEALRGRK